MEINTFKKKIKQIKGKINKEAAAGFFFRAFCFYFFFFLRALAPLQAAACGQTQLVSVNAASVRWRKRKGKKKEKKKEKKERKVSCCGDG